MTIIIKKPEAILSFIHTHPDDLKRPFQVLAIIRCRKEWFYLVEYEEWLTWWKKDWVEVIDDFIPSDWIITQYSKLHKIKNANYDFKLKINYYQGPKVFLENKNFLFDISENPDTAYEFYYQYWREHVNGEGTLWRIRTYRGTYLY